MKIRNTLVPGSITVGRRIGDVSHDANKRLRWFDYYYSHSRNARLTCRHFDITPDTFYKWKRRYRPSDLKTLEDHSHRPKRVRQPTWSVEQIQAVLKIREEHPRWGKEKLANLLTENGIKVSASMVGRIMRYLKDRGVLKEPLRQSISARKRTRNRPYATRKPKENT